MSKGAMFLLRLCKLSRINRSACSVLPDLIRRSADLHDFKLDEILQLCVVQ